MRFCTFCKEETDQIPCSKCSQGDPATILKALNEPTRIAIECDNLLNDAKIYNADTGQEIVTYNAVIRLHPGRAFPYLEIEVGDIDIKLDEVRTSVRIKATTKP